MSDITDLAFKPGVIDAVNHEQVVRFVRQTGQEQSRFSGRSWVALDAGAPMSVSYLSDVIDGKRLVALTLDELGLDRGIYLVDDCESRRSAIVA